MLYKLVYTLPALIMWVKRKKHNFELDEFHNDQQKKKIKNCFDCDQKHALVNIVSVISWVKIQLGFLFKQAQLLNSMFCLGSTNL